MWIHGVCPADAAHDVTLIAGLVALAEGEAISDVFDGIAVEIDFEFIHAFRVITRRRNGAEDGVADVDQEDGSCLAAKHVQVRDIEAYVLPGNRRVQVMRHREFLS